MNGDSSAMWSWRLPLDIGELGAQLMLQPLRKGVDAPRTAMYVPTQFVKDTGTIRVIKDAWAAYESEGRLILTSRLVANNRDYVVRYAFDPSGEFTVNVDVGGWTLVKVSDDSVMSSESHDQERVRFIAPYLLAPIAQHAIGVRADLDVDTAVNTVDEIEVFKDDDTTANRQGNVTRVDITELRFEQEAQRMNNAATLRRWRVRSAQPDSVSGITPGYEIASTGAGAMLLGDKNYTHRRAKFADHHLSVTRYHDNELHATGDLVNQSQEGRGLPDYVKNNESVRNTDVVTWITMIVNEVPRPEDVPLMRTQRCSVSFLPSGFVKRR
jgi:primary-amine oxidase